MRWHTERKKPEDDADDDEADKILRHPSDASQWKALDIEYPKFGDDPRNVRLGVSTDGLNPFGSQSNTHSTWPMFVWMYDTSKMYLLSRTLLLLNTTNTD
jgi:hypothetical protein